MSIEEFIFACINNDLEKIKKIDTTSFDAVTLLDCVSIIVNKDYKHIGLWLMTESKDRSRFFSIFWEISKYSQTVADDIVFV